MTVFFDLAAAVGTGVIPSALVFAWQYARHIGMRVYFNEKDGKVYVLSAPLLFASTRNFQELFTPKADPNDVIVDF